jgi:hypothetical protein
MSTTKKSTSSSTGRDDIRYEEKQMLQSIRSVASEVDSLLGNTNKVYNQLSLKEKSLIDLAKNRSKFGSKQLSVELQKLKALEKTLTAVGAIKDSATELTELMKQQPHLSAMLTEDESKRVKYLETAVDLNEELLTNDEELLKSMAVF